MDLSLHEPTPRLGPHDIEVSVLGAGLNFRDVLNVLGQYPGQPPLGAECSGTVTRVGSAVQRFTTGDHVLAVASNTFSDTVVIHEDLAVSVPEQLDPQAAATIPIAYLTASVALEDLGGLCEHDSVLIHAATGGSVLPRSNWLGRPVRPYLPQRAFQNTRCFVSWVLNTSLIHARRVLLQRSWRRRRGRGLISC